MEMQFKFDDFVDQVKRTNSIKKLNTLLTKYFNNFGVKMYSYHFLEPLIASDFQSMDVLIQAGFPNWWKAFYKDDDFCINNPFIASVINKKQIFTWNELVQIDHEKNNISKYASRIEELDVGIGIAFSVYGPLSHNGVFSFGFEKNYKKLNDINIALLQWSCQMVHYRLIDILKAKVEPKIFLSNRESDIIKWVALGKSNIQIAHILGISKHVINVHLKCIFLKFGVKDRVSVSLKAISLGLV